MKSRAQDLGIRQRESVGSQACALNPRADLPLEKAEE